MGHLADPTKTFSNSIKLAGASLVRHTFIQEPEGFFSDGHSYFEFKLDTPCSSVDLEYRFITPQTNMVRLFFSYADSSEDFCGTYFLGSTDGKFNSSLGFIKPVHSIRILPCEKAGCFETVNISLFASGRNLPAIDHPFGWLVSAAASADLLPGRSVCLFTHDTGVSGAPMMCRKIGEQLRKLGWGVVVVSPLDAGVQEFSKAADLFFVEDGEPGYMRLFAEGLYAAGIRIAMMNTVVTGHWAKALADAGIYTLGLVHEMATAIRMMMMQENCMAMRSYCKKLVFPSDIVMRDFELVTGKSVGKNQWAVIPYGYYREEKKHSFSAEQKKEFLARYGIPSDGIVLCGSGVIHIAKGIDLVSFVIKKLKDLERHTARPVHLLWMGNTSQHEYRGWVESQFRKMGLAGRLHFTGFIDNDEQYALALACADVFVLPSREDSMPSVLIEAMAAGRPVVAFKDSGGANDMLSEGKGVLVPYLDTGEFADAVSSLVLNKDMADEITAKAYDYFLKQGRFEDYVQKLIDEVKIGEPLSGKQDITEFPLYSFVLAHYNQLDTINQALDSIMAQNYPNIELVVMDDGTAGYSQPDIESYIRRKNTGNIRKTAFVTNSSNLGTTKAFNLAMSKATGKFLHIFAADDVLANPDVALRFVQRFSRMGPETEIIAAGALMYDETLQHFQEIFVPPQLQQQYEGMDAGQQFIRCTLKNIFPIAACCMRSSLFKRLGPFDENIALMEDWPFFLNILSHGVRVEPAGFPALYHRAGGVSYSILETGSVYDLQFRLDRLRTMERWIFPELSNLPMDVQMQVYQIYMDDAAEYSRRGGQEKTMHSAEILKKSPALAKRKKLDWLVKTQESLRRRWTGKALVLFFVFAASYLLASVMVQQVITLFAVLGWMFYIMASISGLLFIACAAASSAGWFIYALMKLKNRLTKR